MNLDYKSALHAISQNANNLFDWLISIQATITHKIWTIAVGGGAVYTTGSAYAHSSGDGFLSRLLNMLTDLTLLEGLSIIATILLIIERGFICWAWYKRRQRGDYEEGKPQDEK